MALRMVSLSRAADGRWFARKGIAADVRKEHARLHGCWWKHSSNDLRTHRATRQRRAFNAAWRYATYNWGSASRRKADLFACRSLDFRHDLRIRKTREVTKPFCQCQGRPVGYLDDFGPVGRWQPRNEIDDILDVTRLASEGAVGSQET